MCCCVESLDSLGNYLWYSQEQNVPWFQNHYPKNPQEDNTAGASRLNCEMKNTVIDKVWPKMVKKIKEKEEKYKNRQKKEIDGTLRMVVCHPEYSDYGLFTP